MSKTYWSQRIEELANSEKAVPDTAFFTSEAYRSYTETAAKDMITGVCGYLRRCGYSISEMEEDRRVNALAVEMLRNPEITAYTDGYNICIGTNNSLVTSLDSRELRHYAIQGFRVHEVAHILFTDFPTLKNWVGHLNQGIWWPKIPDRASEKDGAELTKRLKKPRFCKPFVSIARNIENALEDGFIEREIQEMYGGLATTELATLDEVQISESVSFGEMLKKKCSPFEAMLNQILLYAKYDITMDDGIPDEYVQTLEDCVFVIDDVKYERNPKKRLEGVNEICCILYPLVADLIKELSKKPKQKKSSGQKAVRAGLVFVCPVKHRAVAMTSLSLSRETVIPSLSPRPKTSREVAILNLSREMQRPMAMLIPILVQVELKTMRILIRKREKGFKRLWKRLSKLQRMLLKELA